LDDHEGFVNAVLITETGHIATGCQDKKIRVFKPPDYEAADVLEVHTASGLFFDFNSKRPNRYELLQNSSLLSAFDGPSPPLWSLGRGFYQ
jgi:hypothetical protein